MGNPMTAQQAGLIGRLYEAALDDGLWQTLCRDIASAFGGASDTVVILENDGAARLLNPSSHFSLATLGAYEAYYWQHDIWAKKACQLGVGQVHSGAEHISARELERTEFYADFCRPNGLYHVIGAVLPLGHGETALLGLHRQREQGQFDAGPQLLAQLQTFVPHLQRALQIRARLALDEQAERSMRAVLDAVDMAVLLLDAQLAVVYANASALALFGHDPQRSLHCAGAGSPRWRLLPQLAHAVHQAIACTARAGRRAAPPVARALRLPRPNGPDLCITVAPFQPPQASLHERPCAIVLARDPQAPPAPQQTLQQLFGLTPSEAQVAQALSSGAAIDSIAAETGVSVNTVKTHLHHIYDKTGATRQGELVALLHQAAGGASVKLTRPLR
ncbi:MAG: hypothetical protein RLZZ237_2253 [Pseudomonadota bacterium]|jgi:DNA-binding CsgD family transcriptional regulator/PAS domain-containing protein